jgi:hypothetical protein
MKKLIPLLMISFCATAEITQPTPLDRQGAQQYCDAIGYVRMTANNFTLDALNLSYQDPVMYGNPTDLAIKATINKSRSKVKKILSDEIIKSTAEEAVYVVFGGHSYTMMDFRYANENCVSLETGNHHKLVAK